MTIVADRWTAGEDVQKVRSAEGCATSVDNAPLLLCTGVVLANF